MQKNGVLYAVLIVMVLMGAVIVVQQGQIQRNDIANLPVCGYSTVLQVSGQYEGYYVGMDANREISCAQELTQNKNVINSDL